MSALHGPESYRAPCWCMRKHTTGGAGVSAVLKRLLCWALYAVALGLLIDPALVYAQTPGCAPNSGNYPCVYVDYAQKVGGDSVSAINASTNNFVVNIHVGAGPQGLAVTPNNALVYVVNNSANTVSVIDTATNAVTTTIDTLSGAPLQIAVTPDGAFAYVVGFGANKGFVNVIDTSTNQVIFADTVSGLENPMAIAIAPGGAFAYVADTCSGIACVDVIDTSTHQVATTVSIPGTVTPSNASIGVSPDGSLVCMTVSTNSGTPDVQVAFVSASNNTFLKLLKIADAAVVSNHGLVTSAAGILYVGEQPTAQVGPAFVFPITLSSQTLGNSIQIGVGLETAPALALGSNGAWLYATNAGDNTVSVISTSTNTVTATIPVGTSPQFVAAMSLAPPGITSQPASQTINQGQSALLNVVASSPAPVSYQWFQGQSGDTSNPIAGATNSRFLTPPLDVTTSYWVVVSNLAGSVDSNTATVTVNQKPTCTASVQGVAPPDFLTITLAVNCVDPQGLTLFTSVAWGDDLTSTFDGGVATVSHSYSAASTYIVHVTSFDSVQLMGEAFNNVILLGPKNPVTVIAGGSATVTIPVDEVPVGLQVSFECPTVTDSSGNVHPAADLGITCNSNPPTITFDGATHNVDIVIHTTGVASGAVMPLGGEGKVLLAMLMPAMIGLTGRWSMRGRAKARTQSFAVVVVLALVLMIASCSSGGFSAPNLQATPTGTYQLTIVDVPASGQDTTGFVQTSLIVPLTVK